MSELKKVNELGWKIKTTRKTKSIDVSHGNGLVDNCSVLEQIIVSPKGEIVCVTQHIGNQSEYHDIDIMQLTAQELSDKGILE
ncbi:hypothetical protein [Thalassobellus citreus]|uniref:hypothetical protein n=1 Tax=Thalassobellus citreus TaxID=3367752 RepID=UPI0037A1C9DD